MDRLQEAERLLGGMTPDEKAHVLERVARDLGAAWPGIDERPDVCGGAPCIVRTRIPVWLLERARRDGAATPDLLRMYPSLRAEDLANAWAFVDAHRDLIERELAAEAAA